MRKRNQSVYDYLRHYADDPFSTRPLGVEDALVFGILSYLYFERLPDLWPAALKDIGGSFSVFNKGAIDCRRNRRFFRLVAASKRFQNVRILAPEGIEDRTENIQFGAVTFELDDSTAAVVFRGTSLGVAGWIEDLELCLGTMTGCQSRGRAYLKAAAARHGGPLYVIGHSKGGNTALFASAYQTLKVRQRIETIYDLDGPGFEGDVFMNPKFEAIETKVCKLMPKHALVGSLLNSCPEATVVDARGFGVLQHDLYNWKLLDGKIDVIPGLSAMAVRHNTVIKNWLDSLTKEQKEDFIALIDDMMNETDIATFKEVIVRPWLALKFVVYLKRFQDEKIKANARLVIETLFREFFRRQAA